MNGPAPADPEGTRVDARGLLCPLPVIRLGERARASAPGTLLVLLADDPQAEEDVRLWCRGAGHEFVSASSEDGFTRIEVCLAS